MRFTEIYDCMVTGKAELIELAEKIDQAIADRDYMRAIELIQTFAIGLDVYQLSIDLSYQAASARSH